MFGKFKETISYLLNSGSERSVILKRNAFGALLIKVFSLIVDFAKVPILLTYLDSERYGVYVTIAAIVYWSHNFDFGMGAGLRYQLTTSLSLGDFNRGKKLVSTAYISLALILLGVFILSLPICSVLDWSKILNCTVVTRNDLLICVLFVLLAYLIQFVLELVLYVLQADQKNAKSTLFKPIANVITIVAIVLLKLFSYNSLFLACVALTIPMILVLLFVNIYLFRSKYGLISPSLKDFDKGCVKDIYSLGIKYFSTQLSSLVVFNTASFLITYYISPVETAVYNSAWTYFGVVVMFNNMVLQPLVTVITDAYVKNDMQWIKHIFKKIRLYCVVLTGLSLCLLIFSPFAFKLWLGEKLVIPFNLSIFLTIYFILNIWVSPYLNFLTGVGKLNVTVIISIVKIIVYIPIAILLINKIGLIGVIIAIILINTLPNFIVGVYQYSLLINNRATGIWNR